jgi:hypothetical protein
MICLNYPFFHRASCLISPRYAENIIGYRGLVYNIAVTYLTFPGEANAWRTSKPSSHVNSREKITGVFLNI